MTTGIDFTHQIPCPVRVGPKDTGPLPRQNGFWSSIWSATGWWSNCDIYLEAPEEWGLGGGGGVRLRLWSLTGGVRYLVAETQVGAISGMTQISGPGSPWRGIPIAGRGHPGSGWLLEAQSQNPDTDFASAVVSGELWGSESTPDGIGRTPGFSIRDHQMGSRASMLMGWPVGAGDPALAPPAIGVDGPWLPVLVTPFGELVMSTLPPSRLTNLGVVNQAPIGSGPQRVLALSCMNTNAADRFIQLHDKALPISTGDPPIFTWRVPAASGTVLIGTDFFTAGGVAFTNPRWGFSTTNVTFTPAGSADQTTQITYRDNVP